MLLSSHCLGCFQVTRLDLSVCPQCDWFTPYSTAQEARALPCMTASLKQNGIYWVGFYVPLVQYVHISRLKLSTWSFEFIKLLPRSFVLFAVRQFYGESSRIWTSCGQCRPPPFHSSNNPVVLLKSGRHILLRARSIVSKIPTDHRCMHAKGC